MMNAAFVSSKRSGVHSFDQLGLRLLVGGASFSPFTIDDTTVVVVTDGLTGFDFDCEDATPPTAVAEDDTPLLFTAVLCCRRDFSFDFCAFSVSIVLEEAKPPSSLSSRTPMSVMVVGAV